MSFSPARRFACFATVAALGGGAALAAHARDFIEERRSTSAEMADLGARLEREDLELRLLEKRASQVAETLELFRSREREDHARLQDELETARSRDAAASRERIAALESRVAALQAQADRGDRAARLLDSESARRELVEPTVRVNAKSEVGSGTLVWSRKRAGKARTFVLTAWHIVKDNAPGDSAPVAIEVDVYEDAAHPSEERAKVVARNETLDLALLEVESDRVFPTIAKLARPQELDRTTLFTRVYAIGCPLGYAPMPTTGEITSRHKELDGLSYWMISAPTIFGNSGGGIYLAETRQLIGILSRISAYKSLIDVAVPHMGIVTPITQVYDWLDSTEFAFVHTDAVEPEASVLEASHPR